MDGNHRSWSHTAYIQVAAPPITSCMTLGKLLNLFMLQFLNHKTNIITIPNLMLLKKLGVYNPCLKLLRLTIS